MSEKTLNINADALLEKFERGEVKVVHGEADGGEVEAVSKVAKSHSVMECYKADARIAELEAELKIAQEIIADLRDANDRAVKIAAEEANKQRDEYEARLKEAERLVEIAAGKEVRLTDRAEKAEARAEAAEKDAVAIRNQWSRLECQHDLAIERADRAEADAGRLKRELDTAKRGNQRQWDENARLRATLEQVEWEETGNSGDKYYCPWCRRLKRAGHKPDCARQAALNPATPDESSNTA